MSRPAVVLAWLAAIVVLDPPSALGQARALHWSSLEVEAVLDAEGALHVVERQRMVFSGNWNGGERSFRLEPAHRLTLHRLLRERDGGGEPVLLTPGGLSAVDHYDWSGRETLRWRSRLPTDPIFNEDEITYVLDYTIDNVLVPRAEDFLLDHDFAFADRFGDIERFTLTLELDPVWAPSEPHPTSYEAGPLPPGRSFVVSVPLEFTGEGRPTSVVYGASAFEKRSVAAAAGLAMLAIVTAFVRRESGLGRFAPAPDDEVDERWIAQEVLSLRPEEVGALWDDRTSAPEVAAVLARLVVEGKLASKITRERGWIFSRTVLHLRRLVPESAFEGYEASLIRSLFYYGRETIDTDTLKKHYRSRGFYPASRIRRGLERRVQALFRDEPKPGVSAAPTVLLVLSAAACIGAAFVLHPSDRGPLVASLFGFVPTYAIGYFFARTTRNRVDRLALRSLTVVVPTLLLLGILAVLVMFAPLRLHALSLTGLSLACLAMVNSLWNAAKFRKSAKRLGARKRLLAARRWFAAELRRPEPRLRDEWYPYVVAFGLERDADRWFSAHGGERPVSDRWYHGTTGSSGVGTGPAWSGGGGAFGGAGASGSWAKAATAVGRGVSRPSSGSGSSGGSSSSSSSSGGGGGGGW